jgi:integrase
VFDRADGQPIDPDTFSKAFRGAATRVGLDGVRLHDLTRSRRCSFRPGTSVRVVSDLLGHATVGFTLGVYTHPSEQEAAAAVAEAEGLTGGEA